MPKATLAEHTDIRHSRNIYTTLQVLPCVIEDEGHPGVLRLDFPRVSHSTVTNHASLDCLRFGRAKPISDY